MSPRACVVLLAALSVSAGCGTTEKAVESGLPQGTTDVGGSGDGGAGDGSGDGGAGDGGSGDAPQAPEAVVLDVRCTVRVTGDTYVGWSVDATASDPQGADTLLSVVGDGVVVVKDGVEVHRSALSCAVVDLEEAICSGAFVQWDDTPDCSDVPSVEVYVIAEDEDGNRGESAAMAAREE